MSYVLFNGGRGELRLPDDLEALIEKVARRKPHAVLKAKGRVLYKHCACCGKWKPSLMFYANKRRWDKLDYYCKECRNEHSHKR